MVVSVAFNLAHSTAKKKKKFSKSEFFFACHNSNMKTGPLQVKENINWFALLTELQDNGRPKTTPVQVTANLIKVTQH